MAQVQVQVGDAAPAFVLKDQTEQLVPLRDLRGRKVILSFHPLAWTSICAAQMQDLEKRRSDLERLGAAALGLSVDSVPSKKAWAEAIGVKATRLLADFWPHGGVARAYGVFREQSGFSERAVFVVDTQGAVTWKKLYPIKERPDIEEILHALAEV